MANKVQQNNYNPDTTGVRESVEYRRRTNERKAIDKNKQSRWKRFTAFFKNDRVLMATGIVVMLIGVFLAISFISYFFISGASDQSRVDNYNIMQNARSAKEINNLGASLGATLSEMLIAQGFGVGALVLVLWCLILGYRFLRHNGKIHFFTHTLFALFSVFSLSMVVGAATYFIDDLFFFPLGGNFGKYANEFLLGLTGIYGMFAINFVIAMIWTMLAWNTIKKLWASVPKFPKRVADDDDSWKESEGFVGDGKKKDDVAPVLTTAAETTPFQEPVKPTTDVQNVEEPKQPVTLNDQFAVARSKTPAQKQTEKKVSVPADNGPETTISVAADIQTVDTKKITNPHDPTGEYIHYKFPEVELMRSFNVRTNNVDITEQEANKKRIIDTLSNYGIEIKKIDVHVGPTITLFEIVPQEGVRISKIKNLEDDIALSLAALGIRIIAPMPGRGTIGIEVPNHDPQIVPMRDVLASKAFQESKAKLPMVLGCTVSNEVFVGDLTKMPHLLVAGATGQGKSVGLNAIITSLLYRKGPSELKFVLIDPKSVEFSLYADLEKYYFARVPGEEKPIITQPDKVVNALNSLVQEMEDRYHILEECRVRKVEDYNDKWRRELRGLEDSNGRPFRYMPYIVVIIDEFADLIMTAGKEVESPIVRIAQKARAVGIHMIIATQRPSTNVITGLIKANFPGRIAFRVTQMVDSRTIIDRPGAQQLIGRGDMLFSANGEITRLQCPLVDTPDVEALCEFIKEQEDNDKNIEHEIPYQLPEYVAPVEGADGGAVAGSSGGDRDSLFEEAARWIVQNDTASTSSLQRRYQIGYNRAGRLMDQMEAAGIVGASVGAKPRKVLMNSMDLDLMFGANK